MFLVAVLVLLFLMYRFYTFRAEMVFIMTLLTPAMLLIGAYHLTGEYREAGIFLLIVGIFLLAVVMFMYRITARGVEKEFRSAYYKNLLWCTQISSDILQNDDCFFICSRYAWRCIT